MWYLSDTLLYKGEGGQGEGGRGHSKAPAAGDRIEQTTHKPATNTIPQPGTKGEREGRGGRQRGEKRARKKGERKEGEKGEAERAA